MQPRTKKARKSKDSLLDKYRLRRSLLVGFGRLFLPLFECWNFAKQT
jgi:hypothetical protein